MKRDVPDYVPDMDKLNNSYTTYVNYAYLNDCIKACKGKHSSVKKVSSANKGPNVIPVALNARVRHKSLGEGRIVEKEDNGVLTVAFEGQFLHYMYPVTGTLALV